MQCNPEAHVFYGFFIETNEFSVNEPAADFMERSLPFGRYRDDQGTPVGVSMADYYRELNDIDGVGHYVYVIVSRQSVGDYVDGPGKERGGLPLNLSVDSTWGNLLRRFCDETGIPYHEPQWCLALDIDY